MIEIHNLDGAGEVLTGEVPDPGSPIPQHDQSLGLVAAAALRLCVENGAEVQTIGHVGSSSALGMVHRDLVADG